MNKVQELKSLQSHPGWSHVIEYILATQSMKFNEIASKDSSTETILKGVGSIDAFRKFMAWAENSAKQNSEE